MVLFLPTLERVSSRDESIVKGCWHRRGPLPPPPLRLQGKEETIALTKFPILFTWQTRPRKTHAFASLPEGLFWMLYLIFSLCNPLLLWYWEPIMYLKVLMWALQGVVVIQTCSYIERVSSLCTHVIWLNLWGSPKTGSLSYGFTFCGHDVTCILSDQTRLCGR